MTKVPFGNAARATRRVASGIGCSSFARNDIRLLLPALLGDRRRPTRPTDQGPVVFASSVTVGNGPSARGDGWRGSQYRWPANGPVRAPEATGRAFSEDSLEDIGR